MSYGYFSFLEGKEDEVKYAEIASKYHVELIREGKGIRNRGHLISEVRVR